MKNLIRPDLASLPLEYVEKLIARIEEHLWYEPNTGCWLWTGWESGNGYGKISVMGKAMMAHRVIYELVFGPIREGFILDHEVCNTRCCCNPHHLDPCTVKDNTHRGQAVLFNGEW